MPLAPPMPAIPGQDYYLSLAFSSYESGALVDPAAVTLDITFGGQAGLVPDVAGPFQWNGSSAPAPGTVWRTGTGQFTFWWQVPTAALLAGE